MHVLLTKNGGRLLHHHSTKIIYLLVFPVTTCQGCIHHYPSLFLDFPCFPYSEPWRMTRFSLSSTLWVLIEEKCISPKQVVLSIFFCKQGVNRSVVLVWMFSLIIPPFEHNNKGTVAIRFNYTRYCIHVVLSYNILQDEFSFIIFGKGPYSPSAVFLRHPAFA